MCAVHKTYHCCHTSNVVSQSKRDILVLIRSFRSCRLRNSLITMKKHANERHRIICNGWWTLLLSGDCKGVMHTAKKLKDT
ncbi:hypothetical protein KC337_g10 [Hortaea werneckii]|nr:hypothetical protein KC337_g10 [Hortaea werneckii]